MNKNKHGGAGRGQGRKPTGKVRTKKLSAKFTEDERQSILDSVSKTDLTQSDFILKKCLDKGK